MKKLFLVTTLTLFYSSIQAQFNDNAPWMKELISNKEIQTNTNGSSNNELSLNEMSEAFKTYWESRDQNAKGSGFKPFKRWESFWENFTDQNGYLPTSEELWNAGENHIAFGVNNSLADESNWQPMGPFTLLNAATSSANIGRINAIIVDPNNPNTYYVGAPAGGLWKSTNSGNNWTPLTDQLPQIGVSGIAIDPSNSNIIYIATGDDDASDTVSAGVFKSIDAGLTWSQTGLNPSNTPNLMNDIYIHPTDSNILWVATSSGVYKSSDAGVSWTNVRSGNFRDIKLKPGDPNTVYAVTSNVFYKSTNGGDTFTPISNGLPSSSGRLVIDVTPADADYVYVLSVTTGNGFQGIYKSTDSATSFTRSNNNTNILESTQAWYDLALGVSDTDPEEIFVGCLNVWRSGNGGDSFNVLNSWFSRNASYTHADIHLLRFYDNALYAGTDGGIFKSTDNGTTFTDLSQGLQIGQFYHIGVATTNSSKIAGGLQDNGGFGLTSSGGWNNYHGGDGMEGEVDPNNENLYYGFTQFGGSLNISNNAGESSSGGASGPESGEWITPLAINNESEVYAAYSRVYLFNGTNFNAISPSINGSNLDVLEIDPSNSNNMYIAEGEQFYKSTDKAVSFSNSFNFSSNINSIEVHSSDSNIIYVVTSGSGVRGVFKSTDGGSSFDNITTNLPADQAYFDVAHQGRNSTNPIFVGTSLGVYRLDDTSTNWEPFFINLPNVPVRDIEITLDDEKITAATYGRGVWQSSIPVEIPADDIRLKAVNKPINNSLDCGNSLIPEITVKNNGMNIINTVTINYIVDRVPFPEYSWTGTIASLDDEVIQLPEIIDLTFGEHSITITTTISNDAYSDNNTSQNITFSINNSATVPYTNDFEPGNPDFLAYNEAGTRSEWEKGVPTGTLLNSAASGSQVYATNLSGNHSDNTKDYLTSPCLDFSVLTNPILKFNMAYDLELNYDIVYVEYSVNSGDNWEILGTIDSQPNWYNSNRTNASSGTANDCQNCPGSQWIGTDTTFAEYAYNFEINASLGETDLTSEANIIFRIVFHSDPNTTQEGVVIDDFVVEGTALSINEYEKNVVFIYPNPSNNIFNIKTSITDSFKFKVYDITGKLLMSQQDVNGTEYQLDMSRYSKGIYFLNIISKNNKITKKLILN